MMPATGGPSTTRAPGPPAADRRPVAEDLGRRLAEELGDPDSFAAVLRSGLARLGDPEFVAGQRRIAPGIGLLHGVRAPEIAAAVRGFRGATNGERTSSWLFVVDRLLREPELEARWFAFGLLDRLLVDDTERTWQLIRRAAREAADWITVDTLARPVAIGVLNEDYRWAELEQLVYSPSRWERRLVGSTIATIPFVDRRRGRGPDVVTHGLGLIRELIGDAEPDVAKALAWAFRSLAVVDTPATVRSLAEEAATAAATDDGYRAWVIRDALTKVEASDAARIRNMLAGVRRRAGAPATSRASAIALRLGGGLLGRPLAQPPLA
ncbi:MAG: alkylation repair enzyme [Chloroflexota bacterium]|jgi:3-methyladenine DNA glycosylase AlkD|nr:alkylation repair enzyme [Chloroflexota bacterium]